MPLPQGSDGNGCLRCQALAVGTQGCLPRAGETPASGGPQSVGQLTPVTAQRGPAAAHASLASCRSRCEPPRSPRLLRLTHPRRTRDAWTCLLFVSAALMKVFLLTFYSIFFFSCFLHHLFMQKNKYQTHQGVTKCSELASLC